MGDPDVSVILATYNRPNALERVLEGYQRQTASNFELIVADDGSAPPTRAVVERFGVRHVRQEDDGFRKSRILNAAFRESRGRILVFSDGDCVPPPDYVGRHRTACGPNTFCVGGYVPLSEAWSRAADPFAGDWLRGHRLRLTLTHLRNRIYIFLRKRHRPKVYGCNLSVDRDAFVAVNGFDENFDGFGKEDSDLRNRLLRHGARPVSLWNRCTVAHLHSSLDATQPSRRGPSRRRARTYYRRPDVPARCANGLVKEGEIARP